MAQIDRIDVREYLRVNELTCVQLAEILGAPPSVISTFVRGFNGVSPNRLLQWKKKLGVEIYSKKAEELASQRSKACKSCKKCYGLPHAVRGKKCAGCGLLPNAQPLTQPVDGWSYSSPCGWFDSFWSGC
jgi:hypothetical protein